MDPVTTLGVAAAVLQFVQFSSSLLKGVCSIYRVSRGSSSELNSLDTIHGRLQDISSDLCGPAQRPDDCSRNEARLYDLAKSCHQDCNVLITRLERLRGKSGPRAVWSSFQEALKESFHTREDSLRQLHERVAKYESSITLYICAILMDNGAQLKRQLHDLKAKAPHDLKIKKFRDLTSDAVFRNLERNVVKLESVNAKVSRNLESHIVQLGSIDTKVSRILEKIQQIKDKGSGPRPADEVHEIEQLATSLKGLSIETRDLDQAQHIFDSLDYPQRPARHEIIPEAHKETFAWAFRAPAVVQDDPEGSNHKTQVEQGKLHQWLQSESGIFWISGKPGSGKSTFMKFVEDHTKTEELLGDWAQPRDVIIASHYFWSPGTIMQRSQQGLWRSLLLAFLRQLPHLVRDICPDQWSEVVEYGTKYPSRHKWTSTQLQECLQRVADLDAAKLPARACIFIDGLDEFDGDHLDMVETLVKLSRSPILKFCVSSRPWNVFETCLGQSSSKLYMHELTHGDILNYTRNRLATHPRWGVVLDEEKIQGELLISSITQRTQGVFLWVFLITKLLREGLSNEDTFEQLQAFVDSVPPDLEEFFKGILDGVTHVYHQKMAGFLQIALSAKEPLLFLVYHFHEEEYRDVDYSIKAPVKPLTLDEVNKIRWRANKRLDSLTKGLLERVQNGTVQFIHRAVKDWLMTAPMRAYLTSKSAVGFNESLALLRAHLAWYKQPSRNFDDRDLWNLAESGAFYASVVFELHEPPLTAAAKIVVDGFVTTTAQLWKRQVSQSRSGCKDEAVNNLKLLCVFVEAELWDYIWHKLDEAPNFLKRITESPGSIGLEQLRGAAKDWGRSSRSEVATDLLRPLISKAIAGNLLDLAQLDRRAEHSMPRNHKNKVLQAISGLICKLEADPDILIRTTSETEPSVPAWILILLYPFARYQEEMDQDTLQCMKDTLETVTDSLDRDFYRLREPISDGDNATIWDVLCGHVRNLGRLRETTANMESIAAPPPDFQADFLAMCIANLYRTGLDFRWDKLRTAIENGFQGKALELLIGIMEEHSVMSRKETWAAQWKKRKQGRGKVRLSNKKIKRDLQP